MSDTTTPSGSPPPVANGAVPTPPAELPVLTDQQRFDAAVNRSGKLWLQVLGGVAIAAALVMSVIALAVSTSRSNTAAMVMPAQPASPVTPAGVASAPSPVIDVSVAGSNKRGPDGKLHDSFSRTDFAVKVGQSTRLRINNTDSGPHSITAAGTGVNITVQPGVHVYSMVATTAGRFEWVCVIPCDSAANGWAMTHPGYMAGFITAA